MYIHGRSCDLLNEECPVCFLMGNCLVTLRGMYPDFLYVGGRTGGQGERVAR